MNLKNHTLQKYEQVIKMITIEEACEMGLRKIKKLYGRNWAIYSVVKIDNLWVICPYDAENPNKEYYGPSPISINQDTGEISIYEVHRHLRDFHRAKKIRIPWKYR